MIGLIILVLFVGISFAAPVVTPYDPTYQTYISGVYAYPSWFRYLPNNQHLSDNVLAIEKPGFDSPVALGDWDFNITTTPPTSEIEQPIEITYERESGNLRKGALALTFLPKAGQMLEDINATITRTFNYPYTGPPSRFRGYVTFQIKEIENVTLKISVFLEDPKGSKYVMCTDAYSQTTPKWVSVDSIDTIWQSGPLWRQFNNSDPAPRIFRSAGNYKYVVEAILLPKEDAGPTTVYFDDLNLRMFGTSFGILGTDYQGKDIFTDLVYGARISLFVGLLSAVLSVVIGLVVGLVSGFLGSVIDELLMRFSDMLLVLPTLPLLLVLVAVLGPSIWNIIFLIGVMGWMGFARVVRAQVLSLKERPFIEAATAVGAGKFHIILRHILPNVMSLVYVTLALTVPGAILSEAALSWLGLFDPTVMSWGRMLHDAQSQAGGIKVWWWVIPPGLCIAIVSLSFILLGYALDEVLNPKLRQRR